MTLTCIIIEDEPLAQEILQDYISKRGDLVLLGKFSNLQSFYKFKEDNIDLMFMDINLRGTSKDEVEDLFTKSRKIVLVTAYSVQQLHEYDLDNISHILSKPVSYEKFSECIDKIILNKV